MTILPGNLELNFAMTKILGLDPGLNTTGYGVITSLNGDVKLLEAGVIKTNSCLTFEIRLQELHRGICEVLSDHCPDLVAIEKLYSHRQRVTTAILLGHARGVIFLAVAQAGLRISAYEPTKVKKTLTGNGHASKTQVQKAVSLQLGLKTLPQPFDVSDALAIALCDFYRL